MASDNTSSGPKDQPRADAGERARTPDSDIQPQDTGSPAAGAGGGRGTAAEAAMKQTSKTPQETGSGGGTP